MAVPAVRKISETIVEFGDALIRQLDPDQPYEVVRSTFETVILVWNAHVMAMPRWGQPRFLADLHKRLQDPQMPAPMVEALKALSQRRLEQFATDARAVGEWNISRSRASGDCAAMPGRPTPWVRLGDIPQVTASTAKPKSSVRARMFRNPDLRTVDPDLRCAVLCSSPSNLKATAAILRRVTP